MKKKILIGGAWPYANGSLHIGHMAALVPGDILARYHRANGDTVIYVSGSDSHGTPISIRATKEGVNPKDIALRYHKEFKECFDKLEFTYDMYGITLMEYHENFVKEYFNTLIDNGSLYEKEIQQVFCNECNKFLPDRYVNGICPVCASEARGDQCDNCGSLLEPESLKDIKCAICSSKPVLKASKQLYLNILKRKDELSEYVTSHKNWRANAFNESVKYINSGLQDRAATRDIDWGIDVPMKTYENKKIYVWFEAVLGYLSMAKYCCEEKGIDFNDFWENSYHYYVHGKDNIPFHTIILPSLLLSHDNMHLPDMIVSSEYMTLEGKKISTSKNWAVWIPYLLEKYDPDAIRLYFAGFGPETKDADFSWNNFITFYNSQLLGAYSNFINRTLAFINKYNEDIIYEGILDKTVKDAIENAFSKVGERIESGAFRDAINNLFELVDFGNKYYDTNKPWITRTEDPAECGNTMYNCVQIIANLAVMFHPFIPGSSEKVEKWLDINEKWEFKEVPAGLKIPEVSLLYNRIDKKVIEEEINRLKTSTN